MQQSQTLKNQLKNPLNNSVNSHSHFLPEYAIEQDRWNHDRLERFDAGIKADLAKLQRVIEQTCSLSKNLDESSFTLNPRKFGFNETDPAEKMHSVVTPSIRSNRYEQYTSIGKPVKSISKTQPSPRKTYVDRGFDESFSREDFLAGKIVHRKKIHDDAASKLNETRIDIDKSTGRKSNITQFSNDIEAPKKSQLKKQISSSSNHSSPSPNRMRSSSSSPTNGSLGKPPQVPKSKSYVKKFQKNGKVNDLERARFCFMSESCFFVG